jgi:hypothetical protein
MVRPSCNRRGPAEQHEEGCTEQDLGEAMTHERILL